MPNAAFLEPSHFCMQEFQMSLVCDTETAVHSIIDLTQEAGASISSLLLIF